MILVGNASDIGGEGGGGGGGGGRNDHSDALTREQLMIELARLWQSTSKTVLFITHSIQEALFLGDRVIVMSKRPGEVIKDIKVDIARPRKLSESILKFSTYTSEVRGLLGIQD